MDKLSASSLKASSQPGLRIPQQGSNSAPMMVLMLESPSKLSTKVTDGCESTSTDTETIGDDMMKQVEMEVVVGCLVIWRGARGQGGSW